MGANRRCAWLGCAALGVACALAGYWIAASAPAPAPAVRSAINGWLEPLRLPAAEAALPVIHGVPPRASDVFDTFAARGYTIESVTVSGEAVPRLYAWRLPTDLADVGSSELRKAVFIKMMLPLLLAENERIQADRERAMDIRRRLEEDEPVGAAERAWLAALARRYGVDDGDLDELARRVDAIPPALALAQAALETGWGTSDVAQHGRALFGQMVFRAAGGNVTASVRRFDRLAAAVEAYALNLNTHRAYSRFREKRAEMRAQGAEPDGYELALYLTRYSERKADYVRDVRGLIRTNNLRAFDVARLQAD